MNFVFAAKAETFDGEAQERAAAHPQKWVSFLCFHNSNAVDFATCDGVMA